MQFMGKPSRELYFLSCTAFSLEVTNGSSFFFFFIYLVFCILTTDLTPNSFPIVYIFLFRKLQLFYQFHLLRKLPRASCPSPVWASCPVSWAHCSRSGTACRRCPGGRLGLSPVFNAQCPTSFAFPPGFLHLLVTCSNSLLPRRGRSVDGKFFISESIFILPSHSLGSLARFGMICVCLFKKSKTILLSRSL